MSAAATEPATAHAGQDSVSRRYRIPAMDCLNEEREIRQLLADLPDISALHFDLAERQLSIQAPATTHQAAIARLHEAGYPSQPVAAPRDANTANPGAATADHALRQPSLLQHDLGRAGLALVLALAAEALDLLAPGSLLSHVAGMGLAAAAIALAGLTTYRKGLAALRRLRLNMNALMSVAVSGAFLIGEWPEAAMVMALYAIAELLEARAVTRARQAIHDLLALAPVEVEMRHGDHWHATPASAVPLGAHLRVKPGARIALDGRVMSGHSGVNQAPITGESLPVDKQPGAALYAGSINGDGTLEYEVTALAADSQLARIIQAVETAQEARAPTQRFVDRFAAIYTPAVFALALATALLGPGLAGWSLMQSIYKALVLLVIACPCALIIATPVTVVSGLAAAARRGLLIKGGLFLEQLRQVRAIAFDKTGTLTQGKPRLVAVEILGRSTPEQQILAWAAALAAHSDHPVSQAIALGLVPAAKLSQALEPSQFHALPGRGSRARCGPHTLYLGNHRLIEELGLCSPELEARLAQHERQGRSLSLLTDGQEVLALLAVADTLKPGSAPAITALQDSGLHCVMLSGDNHTTAQVVAQAAGISEVRGELLPQDKLAAIDALRQHHGLVAMVGDGINDAPALAAADIGIAMGALGSDSAVAAADIVIMNDAPGRIIELLQLSQRTHRILWQNITLALGIKLVFLLLALLADASMWMAVFADTGASLLVVMNGLRMLRTTPEAKA